MLELRVRSERIAVTTNYLLLYITKKFAFDYVMGKNANGSLS